MTIIAPRWSDNPFNNEQRWIWVPAFAGTTIIVSPKNIQRRILQQHDGLGVRNAAVGDHGERLVDWQFQHLDILAFVGDATAAADPHRWVILADEEVQFFGDRSGTHEGFEHFSNVLKSIASLLFSVGSRPSSHLA